MKIQSLSYENLKTGWKVDHAAFGELSLLVGASRAGKTMILKAIAALKTMASKSEFSTVATWALNFESLKGRRFVWVGSTKLMAGEMLLDEIENSLGIDGINGVLRSLVPANRSLQFIITSHHPYLINNIHPSHLRLVTRQGSKVAVQEVDDLIDVEGSQQEAFAQLVQLEPFQTGRPA